jgi:hypothetical protein
VYVVHAVPSVAQLRQYVADGWTVQVCDPGADVVRERAGSSSRLVRHYAAIDQWYTRKPQLLDVVGGQQIETWEW